MATINELVSSMLEKVEAEEQEKLVQVERAEEEKREQARIRIDEDVESRKQSLDQQSENSIQRQKQSYINELRNLRLAEKQELIQSIYEEASEKLTELSNEEFKGFIVGALKQVDIQEQLTLVIGEYSQNQFTQDDFNQIKDQYPHLELSNQLITGEGGFILSKQGIDYNFTYSELIDENKDRFAIEITQRAFK